MSDDTVMCSNCSYDGPRKGDAQTDEKCIV